jgi:hypothetical protein
VLGDLLLGMRRFANDINWKEFWMLKKAEEEKQASLSPSSSPSLFQTTLDNDSPTTAHDPTVFQFLEARPDQTGFGAHLKPTKSRAPKGSNSLEAFISDMEMMTMIKSL